MSRLNCFVTTVPDIGKMKQTGDIPSLIRCMGSTDPHIQWRAAEALGTFGKNAVPRLLEALRSRSVPVRLGAIEALGTIRDARAVHPILSLIDYDPSPEVRWAAVLVLGEIASPDAIPFLVPLLRDPDRYLRYGAATSLYRLNWQPQNEAETAYLLIARQDWESVRGLGAAALRPLMEIYRDDDPVTRERITTLLIQTGDRDAWTLCHTALKDKNPRVRWKAVLASMNCGLASNDLPLMVAARERTGPDPFAAGLLNFLFLGVGYNYLGKWWGFPVFMIYTTVLVLAQLVMGPFVPYLIAYPLTAVIGIHTYFVAERMSDL